MNKSEIAMPSKDKRLKINLVFGVRDQRRYQDVIAYFNNVDKGYRNTEAKDLLQLALNIKKGEGSVVAAPVTQELLQTPARKRVNPKLLNTINKWSK